MSGAFIGDGYERLEKIPATKRYPAVTIKYRPAKRAERNQIYIDNETIVKKGGDHILTAWKRLCSYAAKHLVEWDITKTVTSTIDGEQVESEVAVDITPENVGCIEPNLIDEILRRINGYDNEAIEDEDRYAKADVAEVDDSKN